MNVNRDLRVCELSNEGGSWDRRQMEQCIPSRVIEIIKTMIPPQLDGESDRLKWKLAGNGKFSTASAYIWIRQETTPNSRNVWKVIWKLRVPERVWILVWLALHARIPTKSITKKWDGSSGRCKICGLQNEDPLHALREERNIWRSMVPRDQREEFFTEEWKNWIQRNIRRRGKDEETMCWPEQFATGCWYIWKWRNLRVHDADFQLPREPTKIIRRYLQQYRNKCEGDLRFSPTENILEVASKWMV